MSARRRGRGKPPPASISEPEPAEGDVSSPELALKPGEADVVGKGALPPGPVAAPYLSAWEHVEDELTYLLGHELGHVMFDPRRSNAPIEALAIRLGW